MMKDEFKKYLDDQLNEHYKENKYITMMKKTIPGYQISDKMKSTIAVSELVTLATHFRCLIRLSNNDLIPVNALTFVIAVSGGGKDMSVKAARKGFSGIYNKMTKFLDKEAIKKAEKEAEDHGNPDDWQLYYRKPRPLFQGADPTMSGIIAHMNDMQDSKVGGGHIYSGEFGGELAQSNSMLEILKFASEIYDTGDLKASSRKSADSQNKEIKNMNFSGLFVTSPDNIIYDQTIKKKFLMEFTSRLARRSFFNFNKTEVPVKEETVMEVIEREQRELNEANKAIEKLQEATLGLKPKLMYIIDMEDGIWDLYSVLKKYNEIYANEIDPELESYRLSIKHLQWKTLKLAGAFAFVDNRTTITKKDFAEALHYCQSTVEDIKEFNIELNKESYELLDDYCNSIYKDEPIEITAHKLSKMGYIDNIRGVEGKLRDLASMGNDISQGIYTANGTKITYEKLQTRDVVGASYMKCTGDKDSRAKQCATGYKYKEVGFQKLGNLMAKDTAYATFEFEDGKRGNDHIIGGTKWICLDVDESDITDEECHDMLADINHHIARTSNKSNPFKFRVILELDKYITIENAKWKKFIKSISEELGITADLLPPSQIYFGYKDRDVLSVLDGDTIRVKEHLLYANKEDEKRRKPTAKEAQDMLDDAMNTFGYLYECDTGKRSLTMIRAAKHAYDLGAGIQQIINLMEDANHYWVEPLDQNRFERTILSQIRRWKFN